MTRPHNTAQFAFLSSAPTLPTLAQIALRVAVAATVWDMQRKTRRGLRDLSDHQLRDIGLTRDDVEREYRRMF
ncbi:MAG: DUF1127 domain-containing protein [Dinoroseobacter sp.]|nr:DUF1127 domain-containing protein [Dinoroseobacter sp.]MDJ0993906.1 DUF1127 domain-containing protein [Dinoroseobacter sp.]